MVIEHHYHCRNCGIVLPERGFCLSCKEEIRMILTLLSVVAAVVGGLFVWVIKRGPW
jgi:hypothetical protein